MTVSTDGLPARPVRECEQRLEVDGEFLSNPTARGV
jgi:hypothetical protein